MSSSPEKIRCSVVIATYCGASRIGLTLASLARQTLRPSDFEVVIIDDGSPERARETLRKIIAAFMDVLQVSFVEADRNGGPAYARNLGLSRACGEIIFFTDDDCVLPAIWMETHLRLYRERPEVSLIGGWYRNLSSELTENPYAMFADINYASIFAPFNLYTYAGTSDQTGSLLLSHNTANLSMRRSVLSLVPGFDETFVAPGVEDLDFAVRARAAGFLSLYIPLLVRHAQKLSLKRFGRVVLNRALGNYVWHRKTGWAHYRPSTWRMRFSRYRDVLDAYAQRSAWVKKYRSQLLWMGYFHHFMVSSPVGLWIAKLRWRQIVRRRCAF
ncbi:MAG: glycosyltransferase [Dehalococcoidia bacterium]|nr:MAG: glycosyltransferase [Dehalococcoidia bacterium]